jgi:hypothetical protein
MKNNKLTKNAKQRTIYIAISSCCCGKNWAIDTDNHIEKHDSLICAKCGGYVTIDQMPEGMKFKEMLGAT